VAAPAVKPGDGRAARRRRFRGLAVAARGAAAGVAALAALWAWVGEPDPPRRHSRGRRHEPPLTRSRSRRLAAAA
jgi:hypothetical protein